MYGLSRESASEFPAVTKKSNLGAGREAETERAERAGREERRAGHQAGQ